MGQSFQDAIGDAGARLSDKTVAVVLRHLSASARQRNQFYSLDVSDILEGYGMDIADAVALIRTLESRGLARITSRAGDGSGYTHFELTQRGIEEGSPRTGGALLGLVGSTGGNAFLYAIGLFGVGTGVLGLASLWSNLSGQSWNQWLEAIVGAWHNVIHQPIAFILGAPLRWAGMQGLPAWLVDYLALGGLVWASSVRARKVVDLADGAPQAKPPLIVRLIGTGFMIAIWPYLVFYEVVIMGLLALAYIKRPDSVDGLTSTVLPPDRVIARWITFVLPLIIFALLLVVNVLGR